MNVSFVFRLSPISWFYSGKPLQSFSILMTFSFWLWVFFFFFFSETTLLVLYVYPMYAISPSNFKWTQLVSQVFKMSNVSHSISSVAYVVNRKITWHFLNNVVFHFIKKIKFTLKRETRPIPIQIFITQYKKSPFAIWFTNHERMNSSKASCFTHPSPTNIHWPTSIIDSVLVSQNTSSLAWVLILSSLESSNWIKRPECWLKYPHIVWWMISLFGPLWALRIAARLYLYMKQSLSLMIFSPIYIEYINKLAVAVALGSKPCQKTKIFILKVRYLTNQTM